VGDLVLRDLLRKDGLTTEEKALISNLVQSGTPMLNATQSWLLRITEDDQVALRNNIFGFMMKAACQAGRDAELFDHVKQLEAADTVLDDLRRRAQQQMDFKFQKTAVTSHLENFQAGGLLGPLAAGLQALLEDRQVDLGRMMDYDDNEEDYDELECVNLSLNLLVEFAEMDRWYARHLAKVLGAHPSVPRGSAHLITAFAIAEQPKLDGLRIAKDSVAYTWEEFVKFYGRVAKARKEWVHAALVTEHIGNEDFPVFRSEYMDVTVENQTGDISGSCASHARREGSNSFEGAEQSSGSADKDIDAVDQGNDQLLRALQESRAVPPPLSSDGVVLLRLTRNALSLEVNAVLLDAAGALAGIRCIAICPLARSLFFFLRPCLMRSSRPCISS